MSAMVNEELYGLEPSSSLDNAQIKIYDHKHDTWEVVAQDVPLHNLADAEIPYLLAGLLGRLHVITKDDSHNIIIMQADVHNPSCSASYPIEGSPIQSESSSTSQSEMWQNPCTSRPMNDTNFGETPSSSEYNINIRAVDNKNSSEDVAVSSDTQLNQDNDLDMKLTEFRGGISNEDMRVDNLGAHSHVDNGSQSQEAARVSNDEYIFEKYFDAALTPLGWQQGDNLRNHIQVCGLSKKVESVIVFPLARIMQTSVWVFRGGYCSDGVDASPLMAANAGESHCAAISSLNCPHFLSVELCHEHLGVHPAIKFSLNENNEELLWTPYMQEKNEEVAEWEIKFLNGIWTREEKEIVVASHS